MARRAKETTTLEEAVRLSSIQAPALSLNPISAPDTDEYDEEDPDLSDLNNPDVESLTETPVLGVRPRSSDMFGQEADTFGRATSPKLYAQAAQFPTATQFRVWRWENGVPVALGAIDAEATEEDFVKAFYDAMPKAGEGRFQFRLRPIDIRGQELGKEFTVNISEHHVTLRQLRERKMREKEEGNNPWGSRGSGDIIVNPGGGSDSGSYYAEEMGRMFEQAVETAERRTEVLQTTLEQERERLREEEKRRAEERISMAERSADVVQRMTEKLMASDRLRADEAMKSQRDHGQLLLGTLTTVFQQQQEAARQQAERMREVDTARMVQDREFFERQRAEMEMRRQAEREEEERRRHREKEEWERRREEERARLDMEMRRVEEQRKYELEQLRTEEKRRDLEAERRREIEKEEIRARLERERMEMDRQRITMQEERERWRQELEDKRRAETLEWERRAAAERDERERRERSERERWEREKMELQQRIERERLEWDRKESLRREELQREEMKRREEMQLQAKQMEMSAQRDREHSERMMEMARLEREAQREAQAQREKAEREAREAADRDRQRQHELQMREMELSKERDREHAERMLQMTKAQNSGGLSAITDMLGMETPELLARIFSGGGGDGEKSGWMDMLPKVLGAVAEVGKAAMTAPKVDPRVAAATGGQVAIQTPDGVRLIPASMLAQMQAQQAAQKVPVSVVAQQQPKRPVPDLPEEASIPEEESSEEESEKDPEDLRSPEYAAGESVNTLKRAKEAKIPLLKQKAARKAIRELGDRLAAAPEDDWMGITTEAIASEFAIYAYIKAVTVYAALAEAKIEPTLAERIVKALKESGMIPDDVPYTEDDYKRLSGEA